MDGSHRPANRGERAAVTSQGYLAQGIGLRIVELVDAGPRDRVAVGAVEIVSPASPLVAPFIGLEGGEICDVRRGPREVEIEVVRIE